MTTAVAMRKQRLRTLEKQIRSGMEEFYYTGMRLKEIRDDELYKEDGFQTWEDYCRMRWEWSRQYVWNLIIAAEYREKLPAASTKVDGDKGAWTEASVRQLTRIPDKKQAARVAQRIIKEVEKSDDLKLTSTVVKRFVDEDLGVKKTTSKPKVTTTEEDYESDPLALPNYLRSKTATIEAIIENLAKVPGEAWEELAKKHPRLAERLATVCDELAHLLRS